MHFIKNKMRKGDFAINQVIIILLLVIFALILIVVYSLWKDKIIDVIQNIKVPEGITE